MAQEGVADAANARRGQLTFARAFRPPGDWRGQGSAGSACSLRSRGLGVCPSTRHSSMMCSRPSSTGASVAVRAPPRCLLRASAPDGRGMPSSTIKRKPLGPAPPRINPGKWSRDCRRAKMTGCRADLLDLHQKKSARRYASRGSRPGADVSRMSRGCRVRFVALHTMSRLAN